ncbi:MAG: CTP synthase, partial [Thermoanaerobaculia bacterium]|nr:CTP synthase [Thermoanaerobaculia bacterium]
IRRKMALFCNVEMSSVIEVIDADSIYDVPLLLLKERLDAVVISKLHLNDRREPDLSNWKTFLGKLKNPLREIRIGLIGKYNELPDAYKSIYEAFVHAGAVNECKVKVVPVHAEELEGANTDLEKLLSQLNGILVAPGFGERGIEGKLRAIRYARENNLPFFGICLGMQTACVEFARNVIGLEGAASTEVNPKTPHPVIDLMPEQKKITKKGGTMRLGAYPCELKKKTHAYSAYQQALVSERHRHRWEFNNDYLARFEQAGMAPSGINPESNLVEIMELKDHKWFVGVQFHPELKSTVERPHPLFVAFVRACIG